MPVLADFSTKAQARLKRPKTRGTFRPVDGARRQLGLLTVADSGGQGRIYWLVDLTTDVIEDARYLAFGALPSHAAFDAFTELCRGNTVAAACQLTGDQVDSILRDDPLTPAFGDMDIYRSLDELQQLAQTERPRVALLPLPEEKVTYQRKRKADWSSEDTAWLPLNLFKKAQRIEDILHEVLTTKVDNDKVSWRLDGINDDFIVRIRFTGLPEEQIPTLCRFLQDDIRGKVHSQLTVEEVRS